MTLYSLSIIDRAGRVMDHLSVEASGVSNALAQANRRLCTMLGSADRGVLDVKGRIDVLDPHGSAVARIHCADVLVAMS